MGSAEEFSRAFQRYQAEQAVPIDRVAKVVTIVMWASAVCKQLAHGLQLEAALSLSCATVATLMLAGSCWKRSAYVRRARWLTAGLVLWSHFVASLISVSSYQLLAGRHSDNVLRFLFIQMLHNVGLFQALAAHNSWPLLGMRFLLPVQLASVAVMLPQLRNTCQVVLDTDEGAPRLFAAATWLLRQLLSVVDLGPTWAPSSRALNEMECLQVNLWWLLMCGTLSIYTCWLREQRAREAFARRLGPAGEPHLRRMLRRHPIYSHHRPALLMAIEVYAMGAVIWETLQSILPTTILNAASTAAGSLARGNTAAARPGSIADGLVAAAAAARSLHHQEL